MNELSSEWNFFYLMPTDVSSLDTTSFGKGIISSMALSVWHQKVLCRKSRNFCVKIFGVLNFCIKNFELYDNLICIQLFITHVEYI